MWDRLHHYRVAALAEIAALIVYIPATIIFRWNPLTVVVCAAGGILSGWFIAEILRANRPNLFGILTVIGAGTVFQVAVMIIGWDPLLAWVTLLIAAALGALDSYTEQKHLEDLPR